MKTIGQITLGLALLTPALSSFAEDKTAVEIKRRGSVIWIDTDSGEDSASDVKELRQRTRRLERAVRQLQDRVFELEAGQPTPKPEEKEDVTCILEQTFGEIITATAKSESKARMDVYLACRKQNDFESQCKKDKITCKI